MKKQFLLMGLLLSMSGVLNGQVLTEATVKNLGNLEVIDLSRKSYTNIDELSYASSSEGPPKAKTVNVSNNNIKEIDSSVFSAFENLKTINLSYNQLTAFDIYIPYFVENIDLSNNKISCISQDLAQNLSGLIIINLNNNPIAAKFTSASNITGLQLREKIQMYPEMVCGGPSQGREEDVLGLKLEQNQPCLYMKTKSVDEVLYTDKSLKNVYIKNGNYYRHKHLVNAYNNNSDYVLKVTEQQYLNMGVPGVANPIHYKICIEKKIVKPFVEVEGNEDNDDDVNLNFDTTIPSGQGDNEQNTATDSSGGVGGQVDSGLNGFSVGDVFWTDDGLSEINDNTALFTDKDLSTEADITYGELKAAATLLNATLAVGNNGATNDKNYSHTITKKKKEFSLHNWSKIVSKIMKNSEGKNKIIKRFFVNIMKSPRNISVLNEVRKIIFTENKRGYSFIKQFMSNEKIMKFIVHMFKTDKIARKMLINKKSRFDNHKEVKRLKRDILLASLKDKTLMSIIKDISKRSRSINKSDKDHMIEFCSKEDPKIILSYLMCIGRNKVIQDKIKELIRLKINLRKQYGKHRDTSCIIDFDIEDDVVPSVEDIKLLESEGELVVA